VNPPADSRSAPAPCATGGRTARPSTRKWLGDGDRDQAVQVRRALTRRLTDDGALVVGPHFPNRIFARLNPATGLHLDPAQSQNAS
jgi:hypothetical protein